MKRWLYRSGWRLLTGFVGVGITLIVARTGILEPLEHSAYRALFHVRGEQPWDERVTVIEIDQPSLAAIGPFPWPRHYYTDLLEQIAPAQPGVVAFDILFAESSTEDSTLALAMANQGDVVLATAWDAQRGVIGPNADVMEGAIATGHIHHRADTDGITRTYSAKVNGTPALSIAAVQHYHQKRSLDWSIDSLSPQLWLNWRGDVTNAPRYSFIDVLTGQVPATVFTNKIVFIGFTGAGLDAMTTPYNQHPPTAGVYQHIVAANNLLAHNHLRPMLVPTWIMVGLLSLLLGYGLFNWRLRGQLLVSVTAILGWGGVVIVAFLQGYWLLPVAPMMAIAVTSVLAMFAQYLQARLQQWYWVGQPRFAPLRLNPSIETGFGRQSSL